MSALRLTEADLAAWAIYEAANRRAAEEYHRGDFTDAEARAAHARFKRGITDPETCAGERKYQRDRQRAFVARKARMS